MVLFKSKGRIQFYVWLGAVWLFIWLFFSLLNYPETFGQHALNEIWRTVFIIITNLLFFEYGLFIIIKKRTNLLLSILIGIGVITLHLILMSLVLYGWIRLGVELNMYTQFRFANIIPDSPFNRMAEGVMYESRVGLFSTLFFGMGKLFYSNFKLRQAAQQLRIEKQEAELNYLKAQTNPHFLFNTLNNIYALARDKSDQTPESILRLSRILRFVLYDTQVSFISIDQELDLITNYIELEKLRYDDAMELNFNHDIDDMKQPLPPLLLIPLIENAFKHGASESSDRTFVDIQLTVKEEQLMLVVKNSSDQEDHTIKENIGLSNLRKQLALLYSDYNLSAMQNEGVFTAKLNINLRSHV